MTWKIRSIVYTQLENRYQILVHRHVHEEIRSNIARDIPARALRRHMS